jgi:hypothetical protein
MCLAMAPKLPRVAKPAKRLDERYALCSCRVHRNGRYALPTVEGRPHATSHHYVAELVFGRSTSRRGENLDPSSIAARGEGRSAA